MENDLQDALIAWQGGEIPSGRAEALIGRLRSDADFRRAFATEVWTLSLTRVAQAPDPRWLALHEELGLSATTHDAAAACAFEEAVMDVVRSEPVRFVNVWWRRAAFGAIAASIALALLFAAFGIRHPGQTGKPEVNSPMLAVLVQSDNAVWAGDDANRLATGNSLAARRLQLVSGRATLMFTSGVRLDCEGPADLQLLAVDRIVCRKGRVRTRVPHGAEGFCVETPRGTVTDLGTELGVNVAEDGTTNAAVFEGQAEVSLQIPGQEGVRTALLNARDSAELLPGTGEIRTESRDAFLDAAALRFPELRMAQQYPAVITAAKPVSYWRLIRAQENAVPNEIRGAPALHLAGGAGVQTDDFGRESAFFPGKREPGALYLSEPWLKPAHSYAVEAWFVTDTIQQTAIFALTAAEARRRHIALVEFGSRRPGRGAEVGVMRDLLRWPADTRGGMNIYSKPLAFPYQWHHLVAQQAGGELQLFVDGKSAGVAHADAFPDAVSCAVQFGCLEFHPGDDSAKIDRPFSGRLAEIALYDRLLTPEEVRQHATLGGIKIE